MSDATKVEFVGNLKTLVWVATVVVACLFGIKNIVNEANDELYQRINLGQQIRDNLQDSRIDDIKKTSERHDKDIEYLKSAVNGGPISTR